MSLKAMVFIDGNWFYHGRQVLFNLKNEEGFEIDYKKLYSIFSDWLSDAFQNDVEVTRICYFGNLPINKQNYNASKQESFYSFLASECGFEVETLPIDYKTEPTISDDRTVSVAMASTAMHYTAIPGAFDIAAFICGSADYLSLVKRIRSWGKRTAVMTIGNGEGRSITSTQLLNKGTNFDVDPIFFDKHIDEIRLVRKEVLRVCKSCGTKEMTTWAGDDFYCSSCRSGHQKRKCICENCGAEEETFWDKGSFLCSSCRTQANIRKFQRDKQ